MARDVRILSRRAATVATEPVETDASDAPDPTTRAFEATVPPNEPTSERTAPPEPQPRRWLIFGIVSMALLMGSIDQTIVATALRTIGDSLHTRVNWTSWTITAYQLGAVVTLPIAGRISDLYGRRRVFLICVVIFTVTSFLCGTASSIYELVPLRTLQAIGGGAFMPSAAGIVSDVFGRDRDRAIGLFTSIFPIGGLIGPVIGGVITQDLSWRYIFFINVPIGAALLTLGLRFLPRTARRAVARPDIRGAALLGAALVAAMFGVTTLGRGQASVASPWFIAPLLIGIGFGVIFVRQMNRAADPIIPVRLLRQRHFATMNLIALLYGGCTLGFSTLVPSYAEDRYGIHIFQAGTVLTARALGAVCVSGVTAYLLRYIGYRIPMVTGFVVASLGFVMLSIAPHGLGVYAWVAVAALITGLGGGVSAPATNNAILSFAPDQVASISGLRGMFRQIGGMITISVTTAIVARHPGAHAQGLALGHSFFVFAIIYAVVAIPLTFTVPTRRGTW